MGCASHLQQPRLVNNPCSPELFIKIAYIISIISNSQACSSLYGWVGISQHIILIHTAQSTDEFEGMEEATLKDLSPF